MVHPAAATGFARSVEAYERARPDYPPEAIAWLAQELDLRAGRTVVDLAAGSGKLTRPLAALGCEVIAIEPVAEMRAAIGPTARALDGTAEAMPLPDDSADVVTVGQAFHWFDGPAALAEIERVLRPGERLRSCGTAARASRSALHAAISEIIAPYRGDAPAHASGAWRDAFAGRELTERPLRVHPAPRRRRAGGPRRVHELRRRARRRAARAAAGARARPRRRRAGRRPVRLRDAPLAPRLT